MRKVGTRGLIKTLQKRNRFLMVIHRLSIRLENYSFSGQSPYNIILFYFFIHLDIYLVIIYILIHPQVSKST